MEPITQLKITGLILKNFRNHAESPRYDFGEITTVSGHNGTGKTTMAHAVCYALYGVGFTGEQKIERLMRENTDSLRVQMDFLDQNGKEHTLVRARSGDKTTLTLDGYTVPQGGIERMFCDKDTFLSMFNPLYLPECLGNAGRDLLMRYSLPVSKAEVLEKLPNYAELLEPLPLDTESPEEILKQTRAGIRRAEQQCDVLTGHLESVASAREQAERKLGELYSEKKTLEDDIAFLKAKQSEGFNPEELAMQKEMLKARLSQAESDAVLSLRQKLTEAKCRAYVSQFQKPFVEAQAEYKVLGQKYKVLTERLKSVKPGELCPTCYMKVTEENLADYKANLTAECEQIAKEGKGVKERLQEISELERKAKEQFEQYKEDDIKKLTDELAALSKETPDRETVAAELSRLEELESVGNLDEQEVFRLRESEATLIGVLAQIKALEENASEEKLQALLAEKDAFEEQIKTLKQTVSALTEYLFKRAELAAKDFVMPNVKVRLFDVVRTTGEVKSTFKFSYKGRDYSTLSLSEKTLAGMELAALMRKLVGRDYPICIDNTESIAAFGDADLPSQVMMLRVAKGQPLTVRTQSRSAGQRAA